MAKSAIRIRDRKQDIQDKAAAIISACYNKGMGASEIRKALEFDEIVISDLPAGFIHKKLQQNIRGALMVKDYLDSKRKSSN